MHSYPFRNYNKKIAISERSFTPKQYISKKEVKKMKVVKESGRRTGRGAYTQSNVYDLSGNEICPKRESSKSGNHWEDSFNLEDGIVYLVLTEDYSNSGKDNSCARIEGESDLSEAQKELKKNFEEQHRR